MGAQANACSSCSCASISRLVLTNIEYKWSSAPGMLTEQCIWWRPSQLMRTPSFSSTASPTAGKSNHQSRGGAFARDARNHTA
eukprot:scaffold159827_cov31-Tisochrysis_lutea.AAC.1